MVVLFGLARGIWPAYRQNQEDLFLRPVRTS